MRPFLDVFNILAVCHHDIQLFAKLRIQPVEEPGMVRVVRQCSTDPLILRACAPSMAAASEAVVPRARLCIMDEERGL
jgi:hypothetical protein